MITSTAGGGGVASAGAGVGVTTWVVMVAMTDGCAGCAGDAIPGDVSLRFMPSRMKPAVTMIATPTAIEAMVRIRFGCMRWLVLFCAQWSTGQLLGRSSWYSSGLGALLVVISDAGSGAMSAPPLRPLPALPGE